ncbi:hypothetical protein HZA26_04345, partial [Candidatus Nomurabacteria bacterium]|nr:hypothetical protein [Candidatus Nomurabacteria bacterium]
VELSLHRLERLVALKRIDASFENQVQSLTVESLPHQNEEDPAFKTVISQFMPKEGAQRKLEVILNEEALPVSYQETKGVDGAAILLWPDQSAATFMENAGHFLMENAMMKPELKPFLIGFSKLTLSQAKTEEGKVIAVVEILATGTDLILRETFNSDGTFVSYQIL